MATAIIDGISTRYEVVGSGEPLLMYSPGGFDATLEKWSTQGIYAKIKPLHHLSQQYSCIIFDRRECGKSGGRIEKVSYTSYVNQGIGLLDHLKIDRAHLMGGCQGCCPVAGFGVMHPERVRSMVLFWPVGGAKYRLSSRQRFANHLVFARSNGLQAVVDLVKREGKAFNTDSRGGPWASVLQHDAKFAAGYVTQDIDRYALIVEAFGRTMFDRDTASGAEPEDMMACSIPALVVPGNDASHATSAAWFLHECLPKSEFWNVPVAEQIEDATNPVLLNFLRKVD